MRDVGAESLQAPVARKTIMIGLVSVFMLGALDNTVISTAMPRIIAQLRGFEFYAWVTTAYILTSTVLVPIYGSLSDIYGRKTVMLGGILIFLLGSTCSGLSGEFGDLPLIGGGMAQLIFFRAIQGIGGAALFTSTFAILADLYSPRERGKFSGIFVAIYAIAGAVGPVVGGVLADLHAVHFGRLIIDGWRWAFWLNVPIALVSYALIAWRLPGARTQSSASIDFAGTGLFIMAIVPLMLALSLGGGRHSWASPDILGLLAAATVALALFVWVELRARHPLLPPDLFANRVFLLANAVGLVVGTAFLGIALFLPLFPQLVLGVKAAVSGFVMLPLLLGVLFSSALSGIVASRTGVYRVTILAGLVLLLAALLFLSRIGPSTPVFVVAILLCAVGLGVGPSQSLLTLAIQNAVPANKIGIATGAGQFFRQFGALIGAAAFGAILTNTLHGELARRIPPSSATARYRTMDLNAAQARALAPALIRSELDRNGDPQRLRVADEVNGAIRESFSVSITALFSASAGLILIALALTLLMPAVPLRTDSPSFERIPAAPSLKRKPHV